MPKLIDILRNVHENVHDLEKLKPKKKYSGPSIYSGGVKISQWNKLSNEAKQLALSKEWYLYYSCRDPKTGKLERQPNIKAGVNYYKTKEERIEILNTLSRNLERLLKNDYNPFSESNLDIDDLMTAEEAILFALNIKKRTVSENTYKRFENRIDRFLKHLLSTGYSNRFVTSVTKKVVSDYLNQVLNTSSPRNRNNTRVDLSSLFQVLENEEIIPTNFIKNIHILNAPPKRNKTYTTEKVEQLYKYLSEKDPTLFLFIKFISFNFLRPIEVCRLKVGDINLKGKKLSVKAKNKPLKVKIIPDILINDIPSLDQYNSNDFLFTPSGVPGEWTTTENNRRDYFTKRFKIIKNELNLSIDYTMYSFRHTFITRLYRELRKSFTPFETKSKLMLITGHSTMKALEGYLRDIDAELPEDYSDLIR